MVTTVNQVLNDVTDQYFNFYDWFCKDSSLKRRSDKLKLKLNFLVKSGLVNPDNLVTFKNNCPVNGKLYDDIRLSNKEGDYLGGFCPKSGHNFCTKKCSVWLIDNGEMTEFEFLNWSEFKKEVKNNSELFEKIKNHFN
jgi:hypothetical protein